MHAVESSPLSQATKNRALVISGTLLLKWCQLNINSPKAERKPDLMVKLQFILKVLVVQVEERHVTCLKQNYTATDKHSSKSLNVKGLVIITVCTFRSRQLYHFITYQMLCCWRQRTNKKWYLLRCRFTQISLHFNRKHSAKIYRASQSLLAQCVIQKKENKGLTNIHVNS